jgi:SAM-dependent methyltransferase
MATDVLRELYTELGKASPARLAFTRKAFQMLPDLDHPAILDIGCGQGGPTLELARLSHGQVTGLDIDPAALQELARRAEEEGLSDRVHAIQGSLCDMHFPDEAFDIVWSEGTMYYIGFERALADWRRFIRPRGFLVVQDAVWRRPNPPEEIRTCEQLAYPGMQTAAEYSSKVPDHGFSLLGHFVLPEEFWTADYVVPALARIHALRIQHAGDEAAQKALDGEERAAEVCRKHSAWYGTVFLIMQKAGEAGLRPGPQSNALATD